MAINEVYLALLEISLMLFVAEAFKGLASRYGLTEVVGELIAGVVIGPYMLGGLINKALGLGLIAINNYVLLFSEFAVIMLIFSAGLQQGISGLLRAGLWSFLGAAFGAILPFAGISLILVSGLGLAKAMFVGAAAAATSLAAASGIANELGLKGRPMDFLLAAGAIDDVISLIIFSVAMGYATGSASASSLLRVTLYYVVAWLIVTGISVAVLPRIINRLSGRYSYSFSLLSLFGLTTVMVGLGFSPIIASYIAGLSLSSSARRDDLERLASGLSSLFGPLFFVIAGAEVNLFTAGLGSLELALVLTALAAALKFAGVLPFAYFTSKNRYGAISSSLGMIPRGEMGLAIAVTGLEAGLIGNYIYTSIVLMALLTTVIGAITFSWYARTRMSSIMAKDSTL